MITSIKHKVIHMLREHLCKECASSKPKRFTVDDPFNHVDEPLRGFLHSHPGMQKNLNIPSGHVIVDEKDWREARMNHLLKEYNKRIHME